MTRDEVVDLIGTIAKSGTAEMLGKLRQARESGGGSEQATAELIGQFGVGFYSSFMVADRVMLVTRKAGAHTGVRWESTGEGTYTVVRGPGRAAGHLGHAAPQAGGHRGRAARLHQAGDRPQHRQAVLGLHHLADPDGAGREAGRRPDDARPTHATEPVVVNSRKALWARSQSEVSEEEYTEFYHHVSHDWQPPLETIRLSAEGTFEYQALLFLPSHAPMDLFMRDSKRGVQLYVKRVFIMDDCEALVPEYLRFVKGVVDANDLSLNISREILQQDRQIQLIRKRLVKKVLSTVKTMLEKEPEKYATFWTELGRAVKEGLLSDYDNRDAILEICSFPSTHDADKPTTLHDYLERMPEGQDSIYYVTGESRSALENSPHMEAFRAKGYEVLLLTDPVDEVWVDAVPVVRGEAVRVDRPGRGRPRRRRRRRRHQEGLRRPADLDGDDPGRRRQGGPALAPARRLRRRAGRRPRRPDPDPGEDVPGNGSGAAEGQADPGAEPEARAWSPGCKAAHEARADDPALTDTAHLLYGMALLAEGGELAEPASFVAMLSKRLESALS